MSPQVSQLGTGTIELILWLVLPLLAGALVTKLVRLGERPD